MGMIGTVRDLFIAGAETTATTLKWGLLYLARHLEVQRKVQDEIDREFGSSPPTLSQRGKLPYTEATILEIQRIRPIVPLSVPHTTSAATVLHGFDIPANTFVIPNLWSAMMDPSVAPDPETFNPDRFLDEDGTLIRPEWFIPFSLGLIALRLTYNRISEIDPGCFKDLANRLTLSLEGNNLQHIDPAWFHASQRIKEDSRGVWSGNITQQVPQEIYGLLTNAHSPFRHRLLLFSPMMNCLRRPQTGAGRRVQIGEPDHNGFQVSATGPHPPDQP
ncbi:cytochrome P450 2U1-like [Branchiostoma floridae x Branchiostoma japonicum]